jgi:hypothetical protein
MSDKQSLLQMVGTLPENATWTEITDALLSPVARRSTSAEFARLYRTQLTPEQLAEYLNTNGEIPLESVLAELEARAPVRESA